MGVCHQRHAPSALPPGKTRYPLYRMLGGPQSRSGRVRKISPPPPGLDPPTVQPVERRYNDWAIPVQQTDIHDIPKGPVEIVSASWFTISIFSKGIKSVLTFRNSAFCSQNINEYSYQFSHVTPRTAFAKTRYLQSSAFIWRQSNPCRGPAGPRKLRFPEFQENRHMKVVR